MLYQTTGIALLKTAGDHIIPLEHGFGGEAGAFYFVPLLATFFNISSAQATWLFFTTLALVGFVVGVIPLYLEAKTLLGKFIAILGVAALAYVAWLVGDVYIAYFFTVSFFPLFLWLLQRYSVLIFGYGVFLGVVVEVGNFIRSYSALPLCVGILVAFFVYLYSLSHKKLLACSVLLSLYCGTVIFDYHIQKVLRERRIFLEKQGYKDIEYPLEHTFWHAVYCGFGFITNDKNLNFSDSCSAQKVQEVDPKAQYLDAEYEKTLRNEVLKLCIKSPHYVMRVLFAKLGVLFYFLLLFANIGLIAAYYYPKPLYVELGYWSMILVSALPGLLTIPTTTYILGFISACGLYGIHSIVYLLNYRSNS
ncbi:MAG: hypothetical protein EBZ47_08185 [Chlamydiae bacterium]|nr:hypothetical protein [Chlamydiota bacterium]